MKDFIKKHVRNLLLENEEKIDTSKIRVKKQLVNNLLVFSPYYDNEKMGAFRLEPFGDNYKIFSALLYDRFRGKGFGKGMYKYIIKSLKPEGKTLYSDLSQSPDAKRVWDSLVRDGFAEFDGKQYHSI